MTGQEQLFFELIRISIGAQDSFSHLPTELEWEELYKMAEKQSLVGICFAGIQNICSDDDTGFLKIGLSEKLYMDWMGAAFTTQTRNEQINQQCVELQSKLLAKGMRSSILKGQSAAQMYPDELMMLRQSGDIDIWVDSPREEIIAMVQEMAPTTNIREHHLELNIFSDTEVEVHYWPAVIRHFIKNRKLQAWFNSKRDVVFQNKVELMGLSICAPTPEFHAVQMMAHMYHHLFDTGIGLRQVLDYYFALQKGFKEYGTEFKEVSGTIKSIGMGRFASAMMYVLRTVMGLDQERMILEPNEKDGIFLLDEILRGGNFGRYDEQKKRDTSTPLKSFYTGVLRNLRYIRFNHFDWLWSPIWRLYYYLWRKSIV